MAAELFGLSENPFKITPDPRFVHGGSRFQDTLREVRDTVLAGQGIAVVVARPGMGKTMLLNLLAEELRRDRPDWTVALRNCGPDSRIEDLLTDLGAAPAVVLLDEAQNLSVEEFCRLGELTDLPEMSGEASDEVSLRITVAGTPSLDASLDALVAADSTSSPRHRIALYRCLDPLTETEVAAFIGDRLAAIGRHRADLFSDAALDSIVRYSSGVPRLINSLCATALFLAEFEGMRRVSAELVTEAARSLDLVPANLAVFDGGTIDAAVEATSWSPPPAGPAPAGWRRSRLRLGLAAAGATAALMLFAIQDDVVRDSVAVDEPAGTETPWLPAPSPSPAGLWLEGIAAGTGLETRLNALLTRARAQVAALALTTPAGDNAFETYQEILTLMPGNEDALRGIYDLGGSYANLAETAARRGRHTAARTYYERGLAVAPRHPALLALSGRSWVKSTRRRTQEALVDTTAPLSVTEPWTNRGSRR